MDIAFLFPFLLLIGVMYLMTRSAKNRQRQAMQMRDSLEPGTGVRTIGGMYALVKEVRDDTVLLAVDSGVHAVYAKNAIGAILEPDEYERIVSGESPEDTPVVPDDASALTEGVTGDGPVGLDKDKPDTGRDADDDTESAAPRDAGADGENGPARS